MVSAAFTIGILPQQLYDMELWEFQRCIQAYNDRQQRAAREALATAWQTAAFVGAAFAGKLRRLDAYLKETETTKAPQLSKEEFERRLQRIKGGADHGDS